MCRVFDVVVVRFGYEDRPGVAKPRPAVVVGLGDGDALLALAKVTSHAPTPVALGHPGRPPAQTHTRVLQILWYIDTMTPKARPT